MTTLSESKRTAYLGSPVILVHAVLDAGTRIAACAPIIVNYPNDHAYSDVPRVACPGCLLALRKGTGDAPELVAPPRRTGHAFNDAWNEAVERGQIVGESPFADRRSPNADA